jgi:hypothetical protein
VRRCYKHLAPSGAKTQVDTLTKLVRDHWGDLASVAGVLISIIGFVITITSVVRSKRAAQRVEEAVQDVRRSILQSDTVMELSQAVTIMEEIKRLHRTLVWGPLPDRYSTLRRLLISIRSANPQLRDEHLAALQGSILQFTQIEKKVERSLATGSSPPNVALLNEIVSEQADRMNEVLMVIRQDIGKETYGGSKTRAIGEATR